MRAWSSACGPSTRAAAWTESAAGQRPLKRAASLAVAGRRDRGAFDAVAAQRLGDEALGLHRLDELAQASRGRVAAPLRAAHRLADHHEAAGQQAVAGVAQRVGLQLLLDAG